MSPNPEIISQSPESEVDKNLVKIIILAVLGIGLAFGFSYFLNQYLLTTGPASFWLTVLIGGLFLVMNILYVFLVKGRFKLDFILFLEVLAACSVYYPRFVSGLSPFLVAAAVLFFVFLLSSVNRGSTHLANSLKIHFWATARSVLPTAMTGLLIFITVVFYLNYFQWGNFNDKLGQGLIDGILIPANPILALQFPKTSFNDTVHDFFAHIAEAELRKINLGSLQNPGGSSGQNFSLLSPAAKEMMIADSAAALKKIAEKSVGPLDDNTPVNIVIYQLIKNYVNHLSPNAFLALSLVTAVLIFLTLKGVVALFYWLIILIAFILFKFLVVIGFAYINLETRSREYVMLS